MQTNPTPRRGLPKPLALAALCVLLLAWPRAVAAADDPSAGAAGREPTQAARTIIAAHEAGDALRPFIESPRVDPWPVAHELCVLDRCDVARAFVAATERQDLEGLQSHVRRLTRRTVAPEPWRAVVEVRGLAAKARWFDLTSQVGEHAAWLDVPGVPAVELLRTRGRALAELDDHEAALADFLRAAEMAERLGWWRAARDALLRGFLAARERYDLETMLRCKQRLHDVHLRRGDRRNAGRALADLAAIHANFGDFPRAVEFFEDALGRYGDALAAGTRLHVRGHMALAHGKMGEYAEALTLLRSALAEAREAKDANAIALLCGILGNLEREISDFESARRHLECARTHYASTGEAAFEAEAIGNLGTLELQAGNLDVARAHLEQALATFEAQEDRLYALKARVSLALIQAREDADGALRVLRGLARDLEALGAREALTSTRLEMARLYREKGDLQRALRHAHACLDLARTSASLYDEGAALAELARIQVARKAWPAALATCAEAVRAMEFLSDRLPPGKAAFARGRLAPVCDAALAAALGSGSADAALEYLERGRAGALLVSLEGRRRIRDAVVPPPLLAQEAAARTAEALAQAAYQKLRAEGAKRPARRAARAALERARNALKVAVERVQLEARRAADLFYPQPSRREEVQAALAADQALVLYGETGDRAVALVLTPETARLVELGASADIATLAAAAEAATATPDGDVDAHEALRTQVVEPLALPKTVRRLLVSPVDRLAYQAPALLFPAHDVTYVPSATTYVKLAAEAPRSGARVLALGDPAYPLGPTVADAGPTRGGEHVRLPHTRAEAKGVGDEVYVGEEATESRLRATLAGEEAWRAVHLACHGVLDVEQPSFSGLALLASAEDDGYLWAHEIFRMRISAELAVLSACETGRGKLMRAEGVVGLTRAFLFAGCSRVLVSLWRVDDEASRVLMETFYAHWNAEDPAKRLSAAAALRKAQERVRGDKRWAHPYYWAAWQLWGPPER